MQSLFGAPALPGAFARWLMGLAMLLPLAGCQPGPESGSTIIVGRVTLDETPLEGATVVFLPLRMQNALDQRLAPLRGETGPDGAFRLESSWSPDGLEDWPVIALVSRRRPEPAAPATGPGADPADGHRDGFALPGMLDLAQLEPGGGSGAIPPELRSVLAASPRETVPAHYNADSVLEFRIRPGEENRIDLILTSVDPWIPRG